jgi:DNA-binding NtrC family response regulator
MPDPIRVLVVDDEEDFVEMLSLRLESAGLVVDSAYDGASGLEKVESFAPDIVVLDVKMAGMDGYEVHKELQKRRTDLPVIFMTGHGDAANAQATGAFATMIKPADFEELMKNIRKAVGN